VAGDERMRKRASLGSRPSCRSGCRFEANGKLLEAQRLRMRTQYDLEMIQEVGYCNGIENYSMHIDGRAYGEPPFTLLDYFPDDFLLVIDESHVAVPQLHGSTRATAAARTTLVEHGFRLPSARDNRPLRFDEFMERLNQWCSCRPRRRVRAARSEQVVEQIVRPTGLVDPEVDRQAHQGPDRRPHRRGQPARREGRPRARHHAHQEDGRGPHRLPARAGPQGALPAQRHRHDPAHRAAARPALGEFDVLVGINLLREGLDLPEVSLVHPRRRQGGLPAQRDVADPDDRPRRPQRRRSGDHVRRPITDSMQRAIGETQRRRQRQLAYNAEHGIDPQTRIHKDGALYFGPYANAGAIRRTLRFLRSFVPLRDCKDTDFKSRTRPCLEHEIGRCNAPCVGMQSREEYAQDVARAVRILRGDADELIAQVKDEMQRASDRMHYERAAVLRDHLESLSTSIEKQGVDTHALGDADAIGVHREGGLTEVVVLHAREGKLVSTSGFTFEHDLPQDELLGEFLAQFYSGGRPIPELILLTDEPYGRDTLVEWLRERRGRRDRVARAEAR
jgi:hypothetical protein